MATETPVDTYETILFEDIENLDAALEQSRDYMKTLVDSATTANVTADTTQPEYSLHEVAGIGRYAVVRKTGWRPLLKVIHTPAANIDFSVKDYSGFDGIIGQHFASPYLLDPLNEKYESYRDLRDNIAAVRNFLMETYYTDKIATPGMTPEKAKKALEEISAFIGDGLNNNYKFAGVLPNHHLGEPHISISEASATGGRGAQYIYEQILKRERHSNWMRPFSAVISLFGGKPTAEWMLPPAHKTEFTDFVERDLVEEEKTKAPPPAALEAEIQHLNALEAARDKRSDQYQLNLVAQDLNLLGNHLFQTVNNLQQVQNLSEPVRHDAVEIAKDILRKLKVKLGNIPVMQGLNLPPTDDIAVLGALKGVAGVYERMAQWARGIDARIMQDPAIIAATQAIGQLGFLAKVEALRMARASGNKAMADNLIEQLAKVPAVYTSANIKDKNFGQLIDTVEVGINTILNRVQSMSGPGSQIGLATNDLGGNISAAPTAGLGMQANALGRTQADNAAKISAALAAHEHQQQTRSQNLASSARHTESRAGTAVAPPRAAAGRTGAPAARAQQRTSSSTSTTAPLNPANPMQRQQMQRNTLLHAHDHDHEHEEQEHLLQQQRIEAQRQAALKAAQKNAAAQAAVKKIDLKKFQANMSTQGMGVPVNPGSGDHAQQHAPQHYTPPPAPPSHAAAVRNPLDEQHPPLVPTPPNRGGRGI